MNKPKRQYATFFEHGDKHYKEIGVVRRLHEALVLYGSEGLSDIRAARQDPPDCFATRRGQTLGIEATEFVCEDTVQKSVGVVGHDRFWTPDEVIAKLEGLIRAKDSKCQELDVATSWLVIFTDEVMLVGYSSDATLERIENHKFWRPSHFTRAYLLTSYDARFDRDNLVRLKFV